MKELERPLARPEPPAFNRNGLLKKAVFVLGVLALVGFVISRLNFARDLHRLDVRVLSGDPEANYFATVEELSRTAREGHGTITNVPSHGSGENVKRLTAGCDAQFAIVQDGANLALTKLELVARLPKFESVFFLGKDADKITQFSALAKMKIGIGPDGGGAALIAKQMFALPELSSLAAVLSHHSLEEQLDLAARGELDLAVFVMDEDSDFMVSAIRDHGLQIANFSHLDVVSRRLPHFRTGRIGAGQFDPVKVIPADDRRVLRIETLVLTNGCASRSTIIDIMTVLSRRFPDLIRHNKETGNGTGLPLANAAKGFIDRDGPELADEYVPWLVDVMPPANWAYVVMAVSILFNAMSSGHRFRLWRIDDARVKLENELSKIFEAGSTLGDITRTDPEDRHRTKEARAHIDALIRQFEALADRSRRQSLSMLVPMGQEMAYRYQEGVIYDTLAVLRAFRLRTVKPAV